MTRYINKSLSEGDVVQFDTVEHSDVENGQLRAVVEGDEDHVVLKERAEHETELPENAIVLGISEGKHASADSVYYTLPKTEWSA